MSNIEKSGSKRATYQDVLDAPPHKVAEVIDGVLYTMPRPAVPHSIAGSALGWLIGGPFGHSRGRPGGWWIVDEPELHLGEDIVVPDIAGWRRERVPNYPNAAYWEVSPDWLCEVLSPSTRKIDLGPKSAIYARERVKHMWMVDPDARCLETFELRGSRWRRLAKLTKETKRCRSHLSRRCHFRYWICGVCQRRLYPIVGRAKCTTKIWVMTEPTQSGGGRPKCVPRVGDILQVMVGKASTPIDDWS